MSWDYRTDRLRVTSNGGFVGVKALESLLLDSMKEPGEAGG
jgi:hypothetical protein